MRKFFRDNPTIAFGLGLPVTLVLLFLLISGVPALLVESAQYDVLYATNYNNYNNAPNGLQISVVGDRVQVNYLSNTQPYQNPRLWRFSPKTGAVKEISLLLPPGPVPNVIPLNVPDLATLKVDSSSIAPDGYQFSTGADGYSGHVFTGMFYSSRYRYQAELIKQGRSIRLPNTDGAFYGNTVRFIGWVVSP